MTKWKKALSALIVATIMSVGVGTAVGCKKEKKEDNPSHTHSEHTWSGWKSDADGHYKETTCTEHEAVKGGEGKHVDTNSDGKCDVCEYVISTMPTTGKITVTFNSLGGSAVASQEINKGGKAKLPSDPTKEGYTFDGWHLDESCTQVFNFDTVLTENTTLYAKWLVKTPAVQKITVTFNSLGGSAVAPQEIDKGDKATPPGDPTKEGYDFGGWYEDEECTIEFDFDTVLTDNKTL